GLIRKSLAEAADPNGHRVTAGRSDEEETSGTGSGARESAGAHLKRVLLTGVSYMIPFVAGGGLLIALALLLGGLDTSDSSEPTSERWPSRSATCRWASSSPPWPATSPSASPIGRASPPDSPSEPSPCSWAPDSSAASSADSSPATSPCGSVPSTRRGGCADS